MPNKLIIESSVPEETRVAVIAPNKKLVNFDYEYAAKQHQKGNIYLGKVSKVEPSLQAAFIEYEDNKFGFLPFDEVNSDYYQIPAKDKQKIQDEQDKEEKPKTRNKYKIQEVLKKNQLLLVQVVKEQRGNKGVSLSTYISLAGRYCVLMPNSGNKKFGVSKKIDDYEDRKRLKDLIKSFKLPKGTGLILRTAGADKKNAEIQKDYDYLANLWNNIRKHTLDSSAPCQIYEETNIIKRTIRDYYEKTIGEVIVEGEDACNKIKKFMKSLGLASEVKKVKLYNNNEAIFDHYGITQQVDSFYGKYAPLESGGYLIIDITEAMISIDVNSGKSTSERNVEETALKTNMEAAKEIARQVQLRDLSGLIVIDFIDMVEINNRKKIERSLKEFVSNDRARIQVGWISIFGLLEMSRQRLKPSLIENNMITCSKCDGLGLVKSPEIIYIEILKALKQQMIKGRSAAYRISVTPEISCHLLNFKREILNYIEKKCNINLLIEIDQKLDSNDFKIEVIKTLNIEDSEKFENFKFNVTDKEFEYYKLTSTRKYKTKAPVAKASFVKQFLKRK
jgi:ribonuclease E